MWSWNVFPSSAIWATHLVQEEVWMRQLELGCDVLGLSSRSYRPFWRPVVRHIAWRGRFLGPVSRACWYMELRHGQWRLRICIAWREQSAWWWDGCVGCLWRIGSEVRTCTVFWVFRAWQKWWGVVDWGGLGMWNVRVEMIGCWPIEMWWWQGWDVRVEGERLGMNVWRMIWRRLVYILNVCSGICGEASYRGKRLTLAERGRNGRFKNKWWWWCTLAHQWPLLFSMRGPKILRM